ncbi:MAG: bifunctional diaminohydroxyphosphoribosylaminopyrimidine deaminase/5-amino-6-(5-phosphoribosylamino)uracil reductase RibD [Pseudomonadota bacterium]
MAETPFSAADHTFMTRALRLAGSGLWTADPNPRVGCVLVRSGSVVGEGWHRYAGEPHAEVHALEVAGESARGATAYVTLEPCAHHGRTPPCAEALARAGVARVVAAMEDPNSQVAGRGLARLAEAGVETASGLMGERAEALNPGFVRRMRSGRPWVRIKLAASLDGRTALASGESQWITGEAARADVHRLRARSSAVVTGIGTVLADDPRLTARVEGEVIQPLRVILDPHLALPPEAALLREPGRTLVVAAAGEVGEADDGAEAALAAAGAEVIRLPAHGGAIRLEPLLDHLGAEEAVNELLVETGATLAGAFLEAGLWDELVLYQAPHLLGDAARGLFRLPEPASMAERTTLKVVDRRLFGDDQRLWIRREEG